MRIGRYTILKRRRSRFAYRMGVFTRVGRSTRVEIDTRTVEEFVGYGDVMAARCVSRLERARVFSAFLYDDPSGRRDYYDGEGKSLKKAFLRTPLDFDRISLTHKLASEVFHASEDPAVITSHSILENQSSTRFSQDE